MSYSLVRESDGAGDSGSMSNAIDPASGKTIGSRPIVGAMLQVGSPYSRTMDIQDWWCTTPVLELLEVSENRVRFRTKNSVYLWRKLDEEASWAGGTP